MNGLPTLEENETFVRERVDWEQLMLFCRLTLEAREDFPASAYGMFLTARPVLQALVGPDAVAMIADPIPREAGNSEILHIWGKRLKIAAFLLGPSGGGEHFVSLTDLADELISVSKGGTPTLFPKRPGTKPYRVAQHKLEALAWEKYMRAHGIEPGIAQSAIGFAFGKAWNAIARWESSVRTLLGDRIVDKKFRAAEVGDWGWKFDEFDDNWKEITRLGEAYKQAVRDHAKANERD